MKCLTMVIKMRYFMKQNKRNIEGTRRGGRGLNQLLDYPKEKTRYCNFEEEGLQRPLPRNRFGSDYGPVLRQITEIMGSF